VLYAIDPFDFQVALDTDKAQLRQKGLPICSQADAGGASPAPQRPRPRQRSSSSSMPAPPSKRRRQSNAAAAGRVRPTQPQADQVRSP